MGLFSVYLLFVQYLDSHHPFREFNNLPEPVRFADVWVDCLLEALQNLLSSSILEFELLDPSGQYKHRIVCLLFQNLINILHFLDCVRKPDLGFSQKSPFSTDISV